MKAVLSIQLAVLLDVPKKTGGLSGMWPQGIVLEVLQCSELREVTCEPVCFLIFSQKETIWGGTYYQGNFVRQIFNHYDLSSVTGN